MNDQQKQLVENNMALVQFVLNRYAPIHRDSSLVSRQDLFQIGSIGLVKAASVYDPALGYTFSTLAIKAITNELFHFWRAENAVSRKSPLPPVSLDGLVEQESGKAAVFAELIADPQADVEHIVMYHRVICALCDPDVVLQNDHVFIQVLMGNLTQKQAAKKLGISQPQVSRRIKLLRDRIANRVKLPIIGGIT